MSTADPTCAALRDDLVEVALGTSTGRRRALVLSHVESCRACAGELERLSAATDHLLELVPARQPPDGFDRGVLDRLGDARRRRSPIRVAAAAAVCCALGVGIGALVSSSSGSSPLHAAFRHEGRSVGEVSVRPGRPARLVVSLDDLAASGPVRCQVTSSAGRTFTVGVFRLYDGSGSWAVSIPIPAGDVAAATISSDGRLLARAAL